MSFNDGFNIRSVPWPPNTPVSGNTLVYNGSQWIAASASAGGGATGDITSVNAGTNLTGGGSSGDVTVSLSSSVTGLTNLETTNLTASHMSGTDLKIDYIDFNTAITNPPFQTGRIHFNTDNGDLAYDTNVSGVYLNYGQQLAVKVKNSTGASIAKGKLVSISGGLGNNPTITTASFDDEGLSANTIGMMMNTAGINEFAYVLLNGVIEDVNTSGYNGGTLLFLSSSGNYTSTVPVPPKHAVRIGHVVREQTNNGSIFINVQNGYEINELHNVLVSSASDGDLLVWDNTTSVWKNTKTLNGSYTMTASFATTASFISSIANINSLQVTNMTASNFIAKDIGKNIHLVVSGGLYSTLQAAIDASVDGDVILVGPNLNGWGDISLPHLKKLSIVGLGAKRTPLTTKIGKINFGPTSGALATLNEIHIENLYVISTITSSACINISGTAPCRLKLEGCYINNAANAGNGIFVSSSNTGSILYIDDCIVLGDSDVSGAGLWVEAGTTYINDCEFNGFKNSIYVTSSAASTLLPGGGITYVQAGLTSFTTRNNSYVIRMDKGSFAANSVYFENTGSNSNGIALNNGTASTIAIITNSLFNILSSSVGYVVATETATGGTYVTGSNSYMNFGLNIRNTKLKNTVSTAGISNALTPIG